MTEMKYFTIRQVLDGTVTAEGKTPVILKDGNVPSVLYKAYLLNGWQGLQHVRIGGTSPITKDRMTGKCLSDDEVLQSLAKLLASNLPDGSDLSLLSIGYIDAA